MLPRVQGLSRAHGRHAVARRLAFGVRRGPAAVGIARAGARGRGVHVWRAGVRHSTGRKCDACGDRLANGAASGTGRSGTGARIHRPSVRQRPPGFGSGSNAAIKLPCRADTSLRYAQRGSASRHWLLEKGTRGSLRGRWRWFHRPRQKAAPAIQLPAPALRPSYS